MTDDNPPALDGELPARVERRPLLERLGMALVALVMASLFGGVALGAWVGGERFLALMAGIGALMTSWAGLRTLFKG